VDGTGSGSCPMAGFDISGAEPSGSLIRESVTSSFHDIGHPCVVATGGDDLRIWMAVANTLKNRRPPTADVSSLEVGRRANDSSK
jgi:hypothetical protein